MDVTSDKHLNPLGSQFHFVVLCACLGLFLGACISMVVLHDLSNPRVIEAAAWFGLGALVSFGFAANELLVFKRQRATTRT